MKIIKSLPVIDCDLMLLDKRLWTLGESPGDIGLCEPSDALSDSMTLGKPLISPKADGIFLTRYGDVDSSTTTFSFSP